MTRRPAPGKGQVHIWRAGFDLSPEILATLARSLSTDERDRSQHFRIDADKERFRSGRGWLRQLLAGYLDADPADLEFRNDAGGKPHLIWPPAHWLQFNLSHSAGMVVFAVAAGREVGVDVEQIRSDFPIEAVARRFFTNEEQRALAQAHSASASVDVFFAIWTRKEAYLKGIGLGLGQTAVAVEASRDGGRRAVVSGSDSCLHEAPGWSLASFQAGVGYAAAVAVKGKQVHIPVSAQELTLPLV